jgi:polysaccharide pyruvyl transferase WcaK-like protein
MSLPDPVLLVGGFGYGNVGDEAILAGQLRRLAGRRVTVVSRDPRSTAVLHHVRAIGIQEAPGALRTHRTLLIGGGGLFGRDMGRTGRLLPVFGLLARALGRTVVIDGVGIDSGMPVRTRIPVRALARAAASVTVRDQASAELLDRWGIRAAVEPDGAALMPAASRQQGVLLLARAGVDLARPVIGLCLTAVNDRLVPDVVAAIDDLARGLPDCELCFVPMSRHPSVHSHDDRHLAETIRARHPRLRILDTDVHPGEVLAAFASFATVVSMRFHGLLFAERAGVPVIAVPYAAKVEAWIAERGLPVTPLDGSAWADATRAALDEAPLEPRLAS